MNKWTREDHSLNKTLEKLDTDPNVVLGLTGHELLICFFMLQLSSLVTIFPLVFLLTGIWILALCLSMCTGVLSILFVGKKVAKLKEAEAGAGDIVWINLKIKAFNLIGKKPDIMTTKERWSCDRTKRSNKNGT